MAGPEECKRERIAFDLSPKRKLGGGVIITHTEEEYQQLKAELTAFRKAAGVAVEAVNATINRLDNEDAYPVYFLMIHLQRIATDLEKARRGDESNTDT